MKSKILIAASLGLLLIVGSAMADRGLTISPRTNAREDAPRERSSYSQGSQSSQTGQDFTKPVHLHGVMRASRSRGFAVAGQTVLLGANCGLFPVSDPGRLPAPESWNGLEVTVFGFRTRAGVEASLLIVHGRDGVTGFHSPQSNQMTIPSLSDPTVGVQRRGAPG